MIEDPFFDDPFYKLVATEDGEIVARLRSDEEVCDFCSTPLPQWEYPAGPVQVVGHPVIDGSEDPWAACDACHELIETGKLDELVDYTIAVQKKLNPSRRLPDGRHLQYPPLREHRAMMALNIAEFVKARTGPARRYEP